MLTALTILGLLLAVVVFAGLFAGARTDNRFGGTDRFDRDRRPHVVLPVVIGIALVGGAGAFLTYRRISGPVSDLLGAAERVSVGDYDVNLAPDGPRELQILTRTFNDMAARLASAEAQRRRFLADITHELRTPLAVLQSGIEAQIDGVHARDDEHLTSLLDEARRLGRLIEDLHTLALADAERIVLHRERVDPRVLVDDSVAAHTALAERKGVRLTSALPESGGPGEPGTPATTNEIEADPTRLHQVLGNLLANAVRHTPAGGEVRVTLTPVGTPTTTAVEITVTDTGPGFPPDAVDQVFERFTRAADSRGSGLGLSIARDLVVAHGGTIRAWNQPGGGAGVAFTVPVAPVP